MPYSVTLAVTGAPTPDGAAPVVGLSQLAAARQRVIAQWIEAFWQEGLLRGRWQALGPDDGRLVLHGMSVDGLPVNYSVRAVRTDSFSRLRLQSALQRHGEGSGESSAAPVGDLATLVAELTAHHADVADTLRLRFIHELQQTALFHAIALQYPHDLTLEAPHHALESRVGDGHRYHPCFKSRQGFDVVDHLAYGPEFSRPITLVWLALSHERCRISAQADTDYQRLLMQQLGEIELTRLENLLRAAGHDPADYRLLPVHPWQWQHGVLPRYVEWLEQGWMVCLGEGRETYLAQQSLRSMTPLANPAQMTLKLPLAISNSSADRILSAHHTHNAPLLTAWLRQVLAGDAYLAPGRLLLLGEPLGISVDHPKGPPCLLAGQYGLLGAIWRESPLVHLQAGEQVVPMTALCGLAANGSAMLTPWLRRHDVDVWLAALFDSLLVPLFHLMAVHGVLLEAHMQNTLLIVCDGLPVRVAMRDLHGGFHYTSGLTTNEAALDGLQHPPEFRARLNASDGFAFATTVEARDYLLEVLLFINLSELAWHFACHHGFAEVEFWRLAARSWQAHRRAWPQHAPRFDLFDVTVPTLQLECLAGRRLFGWSRPRSYTASNPLHGATRQGVTP